MRQGGADTMLTFKEQSFTIEIETGCNPIEDWLDTHDELLDLLACADANMTTGKVFHRTIELLRQMMPDWETAKKMTEN